jgi:hypothetical protein
MIGVTQGEVAMFAVAAVTTVVTILWMKYW